MNREMRHMDETQFSDRPRPLGSDVYDLNTTLTHTASLINTQDSMTCLVYVC